MEKVILASRNKGKLKEIQAILEKFGMETISRDDAGIPEFEVEETGTTFEENSLLKAQAILDEAHTITIADDSGLEVDALEGAPGVYSARFAGENCTFEDNNRKLLKAGRCSGGETGSGFRVRYHHAFPGWEKAGGSGGMQRDDSDRASRNGRIRVRPAVPPGRRESFFCGNGTGREKPDQPSSSSAGET